MTNKDKEAIKAKIEKIDAEYGYGAKSIHQEMDRLISFIDSLPEDELSHSVSKSSDQDKFISKNLEEEIQKYFEGWTDDDDEYGVVFKPNYNCVRVDDCKDIARHFANWQKKRDSVPQGLVDAYNEFQKTVGSNMRDLINAVNEYNNGIQPVSEDSLLKLLKSIHLKMAEFTGRGFGKKWKQAYKLVNAAIQSIEDFTTMNI